MATKKTIELEVNTNAEQAKKGIDDLGQSVDNLNQAEKKVQKTNKDLHASFEEVYGEVKPLTAQMGEMEDRLYQMALAGDTASKEFNDLLSEVGKYRKVQIDTDMVVDAAATTMSQKLGGAIQGAASGFALVQGSMALFGTESEELEATLLKVQSAMAITQGIEGLREGAKSFMAMGMAAKKALSGIKAGVAATGIGLFLVALGAVVAYWEDITALVSSYTSEVEDAAEAQEKLNTARQKDLADMNKIIQNNQTFVDRQVLVIKNQEKIKDLEAEGIDNQKEINKLRKENLETEIANLNMVLGSSEELLSTQQRIQIRAERYRKEQELARMEIIATREEEKKLEEQRKKDFEEAEKRAAKRAERRAFNLQIERELEDLRIAQLKEGYDKEVILINTQAKRIREDILANDKLTSTQRTELLVEQERIRQGKIIALGERRGEVEFEQMEVRGAAEIELHAKIEDKKLQITKDYDESRKQQAQQTAQAVANIAIDGLRLVSDIADLFAAKDQKSAKRAFNIKKAADIAEATMSGYKAVISTYANAPGGVVLKSIQAAIAGAFSAVQIAKIASAKFEGGQVASDLGDTSAGAGGGAMPQPSFNVVGDSGINQLAELQMQPTQAFVVSGDITTAQSLDRNKIQNATI
tara:strand:+ start:7310 stop:9235 length:1926 start_codon:yes stop_codon:yes gene_type:complete